VLPDRSAERDFEDVTWRGGIEWDLNDFTLCYATAATGFLSGGVNSDGSAFESQQSLSYEIGIKSRWMDNHIQLNTAIYVNKFTELTTQELIVLKGESITKTVNGGEVDTRGLEIELVWLPSDNIIVKASVAMMENEFGQFDVANPFQLNRGVDAMSNEGGSGFLDLQGETPPWSPKLTLGLSIGYGISMDKRGRLTLYLQFYYSDDYHTDDVVVYSTQIQDSFTKTDFRLVWASIDKQWRATLFIENIENEAVLARTNVGSSDLVQTSYLYPKNYGITLGYRF
jgi:iron complex outermembrane recepter protein